MKGGSVFGRVAYQLKSTIAEILDRVGIIAYDTDLAT